MTQKKLFIADSGGLEGHCAVLSATGRIREIQAKAAMEYPVLRIPRDYDGYLLHLSDINVNDLQDLRKEQPWSWIYSITGAGTTNIVPEIKANLDRTFYILDVSDYNFILDSLQKERREEEGR